MTNMMQVMNLISKGLCVVLVGFICSGCGKKQDSATVDTNAAGSIDDSQAQSQGHDSTHLNDLTSQDAKEQFLVTPGVSLGELYFGDDSSRIKKLFGEPKLVQGPAYYYPGFAILVRRGEVYMIYCVDDKRADGAYACPYRTRKGVGIGSLEESVIEAYGQPNTIVHDSSQYSGAAKWVYRDRAWSLVL